MARFSRKRHLAKARKGHKQSRRKVKTHKLRRNRIQRRYTWVTKKYRGGGTPEENAAAASGAAAAHSGSPPRRARAARAAASGAGADDDTSPDEAMRLATAVFSTNVGRPIHQFIQTDRPYDLYSMAISSKAAGFSKSIDWVSQIKDIEPYIVPVLSDYPDPPSMKALRFSSPEQRNAFKLFYYRYIRGGMPFIGGNIVKLFDQLKPTVEDSRSDLVVDPYYKYMLPPPEEMKGIISLEGCSEALFGLKSNGKVGIWFILPVEKTVASLRFNNPEEYKETLVSWRESVKKKIASLRNITYIKVFEQFECIHLFCVDTRGKVQIIELTPIEILLPTYTETPIDYSNNLKWMNSFELPEELTPSSTSTERVARIISNMDYLAFFIITTEGTVYSPFVTREQYKKDYGLPVADLPEETRGHYRSNNTPESHIVKITKMNLDMGVKDITFFSFSVLLALNNDGSLQHVYLYSDHGIYYDVFEPIEEDGAEVLSPEDRFVSIKGYQRGVFGITTDGRFVSAGINVGGRLNIPDEFRDAANIKDYDFNGRQAAVVTRNGHLRLWGSLGEEVLAPGEIDPEIEDVAEEINLHFMTPQISKIEFSRNSNPMEETDVITVQSEDGTVVSWKIDFNSDEDVLWGTKQRNLVNVKTIRLEQPYVISFLSGIYFPPYLRFEDASKNRFEGYGDYIIDGLYSRLISIAIEINSLITQAGFPPIDAGYSRTDDALISKEGRKKLFALPGKVETLFMNHGGEVEPDITNKIAESLRKFYELQRSPIIDKYVGF